VNSKGKQPQAVPESTARRLAWWPPALRAATSLAWFVTARATPFLATASRLSAWHQRYSGQTSVPFNWLPMSLWFLDGGAPVAERTRAAVALSVPPTASRRPVAGQTMFPPLLASSRTAPRLMSTSGPGAPITRLRAGSLQALSSRSRDWSRVTGWLGLDPRNQAGNRDVRRGSGDSASLGGPPSRFSRFLSSDPLIGRGNRATDSRSTEKLDSHRQRLSSTEAWPTPPFGQLILTAALPSPQPRPAPTVAARQRIEVHGGFPAGNPGPLSDKAQPQPRREDSPPLAKSAQEKALATSSERSVAFTEPGSPVDRLFDRLVESSPTGGLELKLVSPAADAAVSHRPVIARAETRTENAPATAPNPGLSTQPKIDINAIADKVYQTLQRRQQFERERRGLY